MPNVHFKLGIHEGKKDNSFYLFIFWLKALKLEFLRGKKGVK